MLTFYFFLLKGVSPTPRLDFCGAKPGQSCSGFIKNGVPPAPADRVCIISTSSYDLGGNAPGVDSGNPGTFRISQPSAVVFTSSLVSGSTLFNGLGSQVFAVLPLAWLLVLRRSWGCDHLTVVVGVAGPIILLQALFVPQDGLCAACRSAVGAGESMDALLATMASEDPVASLSTLFTNATAGALHAAAITSVTGVAAGASVSLTVGHAWYYPHFFWYRDSHAGSDDGVRYAVTFDSIQDVIASVDVNRTTSRLLSWQKIYSGLPHPLLQDAAFNLFNHIRSSMWMRDGSYRQWESFEFVDWYGHDCAWWF